MKFLRNKIFILLLALFLIFIVFNDFARQIVIKPIMAVSRPFLNLKLNNSSDEVSNLKEKNAELESRILSYQALQKENEELKSLLSHAPENKKYILASIISRPPQSPYDILIIDAGSDNGISNGMIATAYGNILIGYVQEVFSKTSKVKMVSFPKEETNIMIQSSENEISAIAVGKGGGNLEIKLPNSIEIKSGDRITTMGTYPLVLGAVERIEVSISEPFQKILFRLPANIQQLKYLMIEK